MNDKVGLFISLVIVFFMVGAIIVMIHGALTDSHARNVAKNICYENEYYFVERSGSYFYCVRHHDNGSKTLVLVNTLENGDE